MLRGEIGFVYDGLKCKKTPFTTTAHPDFQFPSKEMRFPDTKDILSMGNIVV